MLRHLVGIKEFMMAFTEEDKERPLVSARYPEQEVIQKSGLSRYLGP